MPADEAKNAVDDHDLAVVAEVDLEAVEPATASCKRFDLYPGIAQRLHVTVGQGVAANSIVKQIDLHTFSGFFQQQAVQTLAEVIVVNDEKLDQHCLPGVADRLKDGIEGGLAVDQQAHLIVGQAWHAPQFRHRPE
ncbi:hypothetical protein D3C84_994160 [compost metagenome]